MLRDGLVNSYHGSDRIDFHPAEGGPMRRLSVLLILLTAIAAMIGAAVILADPIFQGLAISLMFGEIASLLVSRMAVPVMYYVVKKHQHQST